MSRQRPAWGPQASLLKVRVRYRVGEQEQVTSTEMSHEGYFKWLDDAKTNGYTLVSAEQVRND